MNEAELLGETICQRIDGIKIDNIGDAAVSFGSDYLAFIKHKGQMEGYQRLPKFLENEETWEMFETLQEVFDIP